MASPDGIKIILKRAPDDPPQFSRENQDRMNAVLAAFRDAGVNTRSTARGFDSADAVGGFTGEFLAFAKVFGPAAIAGLSGWLAGRNGRKVRIKIGEIEVEANSKADVEKLLDRALEVKQSTEPAKIIKP